MQSETEAKVWGDREDPRARLRAIFGGDLPSAGQPPAPALAWAAGVLEPGDEVVAATRRLRAAEPRLTLKAAVFLAEHAVRAAR